MRKDDQYVRLLADERLNLRDLSGRVVGALRKDQFDAELVGRRTGVVGYRLEPAVVGARRAERNLDGTATDAAGLLGLSGLLTSRLLWLLGLLGLLGTGGECQSCQGNPDDEYSRELHALSFLSFIVRLLVEAGRAEH